MLPKQHTSRRAQAWPRLSRRARTLGLGAALCGISSCVPAVVGASSGSSSSSSSPNKLQVVAWSPTPGETGVDPAATVSVTFDETVVPTSYSSDQLIATGPGGPVAGTLQGSGATLTFTADDPWYLAAPHDVRVTGGVEGDEGGKLIGDALSGFTTRDVVLSSGGSFADAADASAVHLAAVQANPYRVQALVERAPVGSDRELSIYGLLAGTGGWQSIGSIVTSPTLATYDIDVSLAGYGVIGYEDNGEIWASRLSPDDFVWTPPQRIDVGSETLGGTVRVAASDAGHAYVLWESNVDQTPYAAAFDPAVGNWGAPFKLNYPGAGLSVDAVVVADVAGRALVAWAQAPDDGSKPPDGIWSRRYIPGAGWEVQPRMLHGSTLTVVSNLTLSASLDEPEALLAWQEDDTLPELHRIYAARWRFSPNQLSGLEQVDTPQFEAETSYEPLVQATSGSDGIVLWRARETQIPVTDTLWFALRQGGSWGPPQELDGVELGASADPDVVRDLAGNVSICWTQAKEQGSSTRSVWLRRLVAGALQSATEVGGAEELPFLQRPNLAVLPNGGVALLWFEASEPDYQTFQ
ncbi:MAG: Ig-like domain-containing protein [Planctomycetota bacterium]